MAGAWISIKPPPIPHHHISLYYLPSGALVLVQALPCYFLPFHFHSINHLYRHQNPVPHPATLVHTTHLKHIATLLYPTHSFPTLNLTSSPHFDIAFPVLPCAPLNPRRRPLSLLICFGPLSSPSFPHLGGSLSLLTTPHPRSFSFRDLPSRATTSTQFQSFSPFFHFVGCCST